MNLRMERRSSSCSFVSSMDFPILHPADAETVGKSAARFGLAACGETKSENLARVARIDEAVVPEPRGGVKRLAFGVIGIDDLFGHGVEHGAIGFFAAFAR